MHSKDTSARAKWREYELEINGVPVVAKSKDGVMTAWRCSRSPTRPRL